MKIRIISAIMVALMMASCNTPRENIYFSDASEAENVLIEAQDYIKIKPGDKLTVLISTGNDDMDLLFNATYLTTTPGGQRLYPASSQEIALYTVSPEGFIDLPILGKIQVAGLSRDQVAESIENHLRELGYANNVVAIVEYEKMTVTLIGEVKKPGRYTLGRDGMTIIDAISQAGDITINGNRNNIKVIRDEDGAKRTYVVDFNSAQSTMGSKAYYLQQNDIIYIEPNEKRIRQSVAGNSDLYTTTFWLKLSTLLASVASLIIKW